MTKIKGNVESVFDPEYRDRLMFAKMANGNKIKLRSEMGLAYTYERIKTAVENLYFSGKPHALETFSDVKKIAKDMMGDLRFSRSPNVNYQGATTGWANGVMSTEAVDISMFSTIRSLWQFWCAERSMTAASYNIGYAQLTAVNSKSGFLPGEVVVSPVSAPNLKIATVDSVDIEVKATGLTDKKVIELGGPVKPGTIFFYENDKLSEGQELGFDKADGIIWIAGKVATVDYKTGKITLTKDLSTTYSQGLTIRAVSDRAHDSLGDKVIKMQTEWVNKFIYAELTQLILNGNVYDNISYNRMVHNLQSSSGDFVNILNNPYANTIKMLMEADIAAKNNLAVKALVKATESSYQAVLDWSSMSLTGYSGTYQMFLKGCMNRAKGNMAERTGKGITCWVVDMTASWMMQSMDGFISNDIEYESARDGLIGTLDGIPVVRAAGLNGQSRVAEAKKTGTEDALDDKDPKNYGLIIGVYKDLDGNLAPCVFGEYLPPHTTTLAGNYDQPLMMSNNMFSMVAIDTLVPELTCSIAVKPFPVNTLQIGSAPEK